MACSASSKLEGEHEGRGRAPAITRFLRSLAGLVVLIGLVYSMAANERRRELGVLRALPRCEGWHRSVGEKARTAR